MDKKPPDETKLLWLKTVAAMRTARLVVLVRGKYALILAAIVAVVLSPMFHLNAPVAFIGALSACIVLQALSPATKRVWKNKLITVYQEQRLWNLADELAFQDAGPALSEILAGRYPTDDRLELNMVLSQIRLIFIRKGECRKALKLSEFLHKTKQIGDHAYEASTLGCGYTALGKYQAGITILNDSMIRLESEGRKNTPPYKSALLGLCSAYVSLHNVEEAQKAVRRLDEAVKAIESQSPNQADNIVRIEVVKHEIDKAFYLLLSGRLKQVCGSSEAQLDLISAREIMKNESHQKTVSLLYPEIVVVLAELALEQEQFLKAEQFAREALEFYETKTRYRGPDYFRTKAMLEYACWRRGSTNDICSELETYLASIESELEPIHPHIASCLIYLSEAYLKKGETSAARKSLEKAREIRVKLFPPGDRDVRAVEERLQANSIAS